MTRTLAVATAIAFALGSARVARAQEQQAVPPPPPAYAQQQQAPGQPPPPPQGQPPPPPQGQQPPPPPSYAQQPYYYGQPPPPPRVRIIEESYKTELAITYAIVVPLLWGIVVVGHIAGAEAEDPATGESTVWGNTILVAATGVFAPPIVHFTQGYVGRGFLSLGGQVVGMLVGLGTGAVVGTIVCGSDRGDCFEGVGVGIALVGATIGHAVWALIDVLFLSTKRTEVPDDRPVAAPTTAPPLAAAQQQPAPPPVQQPAQQPAPPPQAY